MCNLNICCWHDAQLSWGLGTTGASAAMCPSVAQNPLKIVVIFRWIFFYSLILIHRQVRSIQFVNAVLALLCAKHALKQKPPWLWVRRRRGNVWHFTLAPSGYSQDQVFTTHLGFLWRNFWRHITMIAFWRPPLPPEYILFQALNSLHLRCFFAVFWNYHLLSIHN